jgi:hypothetical protein
MKIKGICNALGLFALLLATGLPARAENARVPYAKLYQMQRVQSELTAQYTNLVVALRMTCLSTNVNPNDLDVFIDAKSGRFPVVIGRDGNFNVPMRDDWLAENPWIITNQPRGTMKIDWFLGLVVRRLTTSMRYQALMQVVRDCGDVRKRMRQVLPSAPNATVSGLKLMFSSPGKDGSLVIHRERGDTKMEAGANGEITMMLDPSLLEENPLVTFSQEPASVELVTQNQPE